MEEANTYGSSQHELRNYSRPLDIRTRTFRGKGACSYLGLLNNPSLRNAWTAFDQMKAKFGSSERSKHSIYSPLKGRTSLCSRKKERARKKVARTLVRFAILLSLHDSKAGRCAPSRDSSGIKAFKYSASHRPD